ncbi:unnamed protein product [Tilletia controversa]|uniref:Uncharacterized protein n=3 Tax=Tilletia TaxID=13289 RepID=A0A8X7MQW4_9BASI|nr:hypothetical protein CF328_g4938 [Tilletia controversa]KAE8196477.1 hypothetical protein CF336_g2604 [Tilletia laevis]KAE8257391.1 hypothetical protein A4X03_0g4682 [Tilletia caries]KAE8197199.1 hypothetical protein CF335_g4677 [Tilletia laevis]KAE8245146.1 hypothetical protein A4X06_0g5805 [Tilletia controversa]
MLLKAVNVLALTLLATVCSAEPSPDFPFANLPPRPRATAAPATYKDLQLRNNEDFVDHVVQPHERQLTLTPGATPTPIFVPLADPKDFYSACFWGMGNAGKSVYKIFESAPSGEEWQAFMVGGPTEVSVYQDRLTTLRNGTLETVIASATCKYDGEAVGNRVKAKCDYMAVIDPPHTSWYKKTDEVPVTYTPGICDLNLVKPRPSWDIGSGNGSFDPNPESVPGSWAVHRFEYWAMTSIWGIGVIGLLAIVGLGVL